MTLSSAMENRVLLLVLTLIPGIGPARIKAITRHLPDLTDVLHTEIGSTRLNSSHSRASRMPSSA